jgi:hypothetical protein
MQIWPRIAGMAAALWWGSLTALFIFVPLLFAHLPSRAVAGNTAAHLFTAQSWISFICGLLVLTGLRPGLKARRNDPVTLFCALAAMLLALLVEYAIAPHIVARDNLRLWHPLGTGMLVAQWICVLTVLWRLLRGKADVA